MTGGRHVVLLPGVACGPAGWGDGVLAGAARDGRNDVSAMLMRLGARVPPVSKWAPYYYMNWHRFTLLHHMAAEGQFARTRYGRRALSAGPEVPGCDRWSRASRSSRPTAARVSHCWRTVDDSCYRIRPGGDLSFEPQKFFIGLIDFFSILLPGALLTYLVMAAAGPLFVPGYDQITGTQGWIGFLFVAYLLGHFIFLLGSLLDLIYDRLRKTTPARQVRRLADGDMLNGRFRRWLARRLFSPYDDSAQHHVLRVQNDALRPLGAASAINAFQWAKARLALEQPEALAAVHRFEADSKFFRSLVIVLVLLIPWGGLRLGWEIAALSIVLLPLAFWRYLDQRAKSVRQAYWYIITMEGSRDGAAGGTAATDDVPLAGGVVFREQKGALEYLLVQAKDQHDVWVLPKGHCERDEPPKQAAVREVHEETGAWARVRADLDHTHYVADGETVTVHFFLMELLRQEKPEDERRKHIWRPLNEAVKELTHTESKALVQRAEAARSTLQ